MPASAEEPDQPLIPVEELTPRSKKMYTGALTHYSMWGYDYFRLDRIMRRLAIVRLKITNDPFLAFDYITTVELAYDEIRPLLSNKERDNYDKQFNRLKDKTKIELTKISNKSKYLHKKVMLSKALFDDFLEVERIIRDLRQKVGMGIPATPRKQKLKEDFLE